MNNREVILRQIQLQEQLQNEGFNIVECGNCGTVLIHGCSEESIHCFCGEMDLCDCPDLYYRGQENNIEFNEGV